MPYDQIEREIVDALSSFNTLAVENRYLSNKDWTNGIKATFGAIGFNKGYKLYSVISSEKIPFDQIRQDVQQMLNGLYVPMKQQNGKRNDRRYLLGEWLYDILWWHENNQGYAIDVPLVAESEWGNEGDIHDDFQRLLLARSKYKIMIFNMNNCKKNNIIQWFIDQIQIFPYTQTGDRYLFCKWISNQRGFDFDQYIAP